MTTNQPVLHGLHHVTAVTAKAQANLDFYTKTLGMRLVKKTVNQDDVSAYHLFYADAIGSAGSDLTFFDWAQTRPVKIGAGTVSETGLRVLGGEASLEQWGKWFDQQKVAHSSIETLSDRPTLAFQDGEGQHLRLIAETGSATEVHPWHGSPVPISAAIVGLGSVSLTVDNVDATSNFLTDVLGFSNNESDSVLFETGPGGTGAQLRLHGSTQRGQDGAGGVHHVAWRVADSRELLDWQTHLESHGYRTSGQVERHYFKSLYFRIPGGILFEIATDGPGFAADGEDPEHLGEILALPPFLEPHRAAIEAGIKPLNYQPSTTSKS
ncbi:MAG: ring-cleaving dioxygenase [Luteolibacter sp.]|uniref:ring-cleaving dioxygenase n=1 Tax=Luteolibacter sp. TaxID=1962973 RepID=UPI003267CC2D